MKETMSRSKYFPYVNIIFLPGMKNKSLITYNFLMKAKNKI